MKEDSKTKQKGSKNSKKVTINTKEDLNKLSFSVLKNTKIFDFEGDYFNFIYERALGIEKNPVEKEALFSSKNTNDTSNKNNTTKKVTSLKETKTAKIIKKFRNYDARPSTNSYLSLLWREEKDHVTIVRQHIRCEVVVR